MRIIFPGHPYDKALVMAGCERLDNRRNTICIKTLSNCSPEQLLTNTTPGIQMTYHYTSVEQDASKTASSQAQLQR
jgi:hypothetical protein